MWRRMSTTSRRFSSRMGEPTSLRHRPRPPACLPPREQQVYECIASRVRVCPTSTNDVAVGTPIAVRVDEKEHIDAFKDFTAPTDGATPAPAAATPPRQLPPHTFLTMPAVSPTMEMAYEINWLKKEGDKVEKDDEVAQIDTDKITVDLVGEYFGEDEFYLAKILVPEG